LIQPKNIPLYVLPGWTTICTFAVLQRALELPADGSAGVHRCGPNRRGMPGWGVEWNSAISKDWGGQPMKDYLAAIDDVCSENM